MDRAERPSEVGLVGLARSVPPWWNTMLMRWLSCLVLLGALSLPAVAARAENQAAIREGTAAMALFEEGKFDEALERFEKAEGLYHTPVFVLYMARCLRELDRLLEARARFDQVLSESLTEEAHESWTKARADAAKERSELDAAIPKLTVQIDVDPEEVTLTIDDAPAEVGRAAELDPGAHAIRARYRGRSLETTETLARGDDKTIALELDKLAPAPRPTAVPPAPLGPIELPPPPPAKEGEPASGLAAAGYVLAGLGAVGIITGTVTGALALWANGEAGEGCEDGTTLCDPANQKYEARAFNFAHASTASFAVGGLALGVGIVLLAVDAAGDGDTARLTGDGFALSF